MSVVLVTLALAGAAPELRPATSRADGTAIAGGKRVAVSEGHIAALLDALRADHPTLVVAPPSVTIAATASSHGVWRDRVYAPTNVLDRDHRTAWVEGKKGHGLDESLALTVTPTGEAPVQLRGLLVLPGYAKNPGMWRRNGRPSRLRLVAAQVRATLLLDDARRPQVFWLPDPVPLSEPITVTLTLEGVYAGTHYRDTSIAEVRLLFW